MNSSISIFGGDTFDKRCRALCDATKRWDLRCIVLHSHLTENLLDDFPRARKSGDIGETVDENNREIQEHSYSIGIQSTHSGKREGPTHPMG